MKRALILLALIAGVALCWAAPPDKLPPLATAPAEARTIAIVGGSVPAASWTEATPNVWGARCDDNAASTTVVGWYGGDGAFSAANTSTQHSSDYYEGSGSFALTSTNMFGISTTLSQFSDLVFTVQFAVKATTAFNASSYVRAMTMEDTSDYSEEVRVMIHGDTSMTLQFGSNTYDVTVNDLSTGAWQVVRVVVDSAATHKIAVYQASDEENLALTGYNDNAISFGGTPATNVYVMFGCEGADAAKCFSANSALIDDVKLWNTAVSP